MSSSDPLLGSHPSHPSRLHSLHTKYRSRTRTFLSSHTQHYTVLTLVSLDLLCIFADIIINLYQCDTPSASPTWSLIRSILSVLGLLFSSLFMLELLFSIWAFGGGYFSSKFRCFDSVVIVAGFATDVVLHGVLEEVASLVVVLRLWRFFKIIEEIGVGAQEQMEVLGGRIEELERENGELRRRVGGDVEGGV
jgi:membrane protein implicated in regulation of membrane protease activity